MGKVSHEDNSRTGIALVQEIWPVDESVQWNESKFPVIDSASMKQSLIAARKSQRQVKDSTAPGSVSGYGANVQLYQRCIESKIIN